MTDFARARQIMVDNQLRTSGITDRRLLAAMGEVPREFFVPEARKPLAYIDEAIAVGGGRKLGAPAPFAKLVQLAGITRSDRVLDVGAATGYSTAVLARLGSEVVAVESDEELAEMARGNLEAVGVKNVTVVAGPIDSAGVEHGPYDVIVVEGAVGEVPEALLAQLKAEGRLVALVSEAGRPPVAHLFARSGEGVAASAAFDARLPPLAPVKADGFVF